MILEKLLSLSPRILYPYTPIPRRDTYPEGVRIRTPKGYVPRRGKGYYPLPGEKSPGTPPGYRGIGVQVFSFTEKKPFPYPFGVQRKGYWILPLYP